MYEAAYIVSARKKSNVYDDVVYITEISRQLNTIYPFIEGACRNVWQNKNFALPDFGERTFKVNRSITEKKFTTGQRNHLCRRKYSKLRGKKWARRRYVCGACRVGFTCWRKIYLKCRN